MEKMNIIDIFFKLEVMKKKMVFFLMLVCFLQIGICSGEIITKIKTDRRYINEHLDPDSIYSIKMQKTSTTNQSQYDKCLVQKKKVLVTTDIEKFRLSFDKDKQQSVYEHLTTLTDKQNAIETFQLINEEIFLLLSNGTGYFLNQGLDFAKTPIPVETGVKLFKENPQQGNSWKKLVYLSQYQGSPVIFTNDEMAICKKEEGKCKILRNYEEMDYLNMVKIFELKGRWFVFVCSGYQLITYEIDRNDELKNKHVYLAEDLGLKNMFIHEILPMEDRKILILDFYQGLIQLLHSENNLSNLDKKSEIVYRQEGCTHMVQDKKGDYLALQCNLNLNSYFVLQLVKTPYGNYQSHRPIFESQFLEGISVNGKLLMSQTMSGVKLYWSSQELQYPYPYDFNYAGSIFLHNALHSRIKVIKGTTYIFIATEEELRIYQLQVKNTDILCFSRVPIEQEYLVKYTYKCDDIAQNNVCKKEETLKLSIWQHQELTVKTIIMFIFTLVLIIFVGYFIIHIRKKFDEEVEQTRQRYQNSGDFELQSNR